MIRCEIISTCEKIKQMEGCNKWIMDALKKYVEEEDEVSAVWIRAVKQNNK